MSDALTHFPPTVAEAEARLAAFVPQAGPAYAQRRNFDLGPGAHEHVSVLSPYLRARVLDEGKVTRAVLQEHSAEAADKFLTEVFWRTYWKGWMELRPSVWDQYLSDLNHLHDDVQTQSGLRRRWEAACLGDTGIAAFDAWARELADTGYLHNHARMWFASIWIFTLGLPWQLGADFFLRHLLDGDAAVNTLSWRWVAGIQTRGKSYLARPDNIARFTNGRFRDVTGLAPEAPPVEAPEPPAAGILLPCDPAPLPARYGILLHEDDMDLARLTRQADAPVAVAYLEATPDHSPWHMAPHVPAFRRALVQSSADDPSLNIVAGSDALGAWAAAHDLEQIVTPYAPQGPTSAVLKAYETRANAAPLSRYRRAIDTKAWPHATKGFFPFRKNIPDLIESLT